jgi:hypothetical protein
VQIGQLQNLLQFQISSTSLYHFYWQKLVNFLVIDLHDLKNVSSNDMKTLSYTSIKCSLNKFCKNNYLKSKINELVLNVNKIIVEAYVLANLHIIWLLDEDKEIPPLNQKFFQMFWHSICDALLKGNAM